MLSRKLAVLTIVHRSSMRKTGTCSWDLGKRSHFNGTGETKASSLAGVQ